jgi:hypothetical protein
VAGEKRGQGKKQEWDRPEQTAEAKQRAARSASFPPVAQLLWRSHSRRAFRAGPQTVTDEWHDATENRKVQDVLAFRSPLQQQRIRKVVFWPLPIVKKSPVEEASPDSTRVDAPCRTFEKIEAVVQRVLFNERSIRRLLAAKMNKKLVPPDSRFVVLPTRPRESFLG